MIEVNSLPIHDLKSWIKSSGEFPRTEKNQSQVINDGFGSRFYCLFGVPQYCAMKLFSDWFFLKHVMTTGYNKSSQSTKHQTVQQSNNKQLKRNSLQTIMGCSPSALFHYQYSEKICPEEVKCHNNEFLDENGTPNICVEEFGSVNNSKQCGNTRSLPLTTSHHQKILKELRNMSFLFGRHSSVPVGNSGYALEVGQMDTD